MVAEDKLAIDGGPPVISDPIPFGVSGPSVVDEEEGERLSEIFGHPLIQLYIDKYKRTGGFAAAVKNGEVPDITDYDDLDTQFNFTEEEVAYLVTNNVL